MTSAAARHAPTWQHNTIRNEEVDEAGRAAASASQSGVAEVLQVQGQVKHSMCMLMSAGNAQMCSQNQLLKHQLPAGVLKLQLSSDKQQGVQVLTLCKTDAAGRGSGMRVVCNNNA